MLIFRKKVIDLPLSENALISLETFLIYRNKYTETAKTKIELTNSGDDLTFTFPNTYIVEGTLALSEDETSILSDIDTIDYINGSVTFLSEHTAVTADYSYLAFNYSDRYNIEAQINAASTFVNKYVGRNLKSQTYTDEPYAGTGRQLLVLNQYPVTTLTSIKVTGDLIFAPTEYYMSAEDALKGQIFAPKGWSWNGELVGYVGEPLAPYRSYLITYTAGYDPIPADIQNVCCKMVSEALKQKQEQSQGLKSTTQGELSYTWLNPADLMAGNQTFGVALNPEYAAVLNQYKRYNF